MRRLLQTVALILASVTAVADPITSGSASRPVAAPDELPGIASLQNYRSERVASADRSGNRDCLHIGAGETTEIARLEGPGEITHLWTTISTRDKDHLRNIVLRIYWDGNEFPSVESPIGDFYGLGHGRYYYFDNPVQAIGTNKGMNCFWPMPFARSARVTITNESEIPVRSFYYYVDWRKLDSPPEGYGYFHAQYRQAYPCEDGKPYLFVDTGGAPGHFVGVNLSIHTQVPGWWGEGDDMFTIDGETTPSLWGTGSEDYFAGAWGYGLPFFNNYCGMPLRTRIDHGGNNYWNVYRLHLESPIAFTKSLRFEIEHGWNGTSNTRSPINNSYSSVAYWYMARPVPLHGSLPPASERKPGMIPREGVTSHYFDPQYMEWVDSTGGEPRHGHNPPPKQGPRWLDDDHIFFQPQWKGATADFAFETSGPQSGPLVLRMTTGPDYGMVQVKLDGIVVAPALNLYSDSYQPHSFVLLPVELEKGRHRLQIMSMGRDKRSRGFTWGMDYLRIGGEPLEVEKGDEPTVLREGRSAFSGKRGDDFDAGDLRSFALACWHARPVILDKFCQVMNGAPVRSSGFSRWGSHSCHPLLQFLNSAA